jgi:LacI family transcriptional regulator
VSISTVSRVINRSTYPISAQARERVLKAVEELSYNPNKAAQHLRRSFDNIIGLIVRDVSHSYFAEIARGVTDRGIQLGYLAFVCNTGRSPDNELLYHDLLWQYRVKGIILAGGGYDTPEYTRILQTQFKRTQDYGLRLVALAPQGLDMASILVDYADLSKTIVEYLHSKGHRRIALISGPATVFTAKQHLQGYREALRSQGTAYEPELVVNTDFTEKGGHQGCLELLSRGRSFTAIIAGNDAIAVGCMAVVHQRNLRIPGQISIVGIGDYPPAGYTRPPLTTFRIPRYEMGCRAVDYIARTEDLDGTGFEFVIPELVERESVANP